MVTCTIARGWPQGIVITAVILYFYLVQARLQKHGKPGPKMKLMVDIHAGKFFAVKDTSDSLDDTNVFFHDKSKCLVIL